MNVYISQPTLYRTKDDIILERDKNIEDIEMRLCTETINIVNPVLDVSKNYFDKTKLWMLCYRMRTMRNADVVVMIGDWIDDRDCIIEYTVATEYGIKVVCL